MSWREQARFGILSAESFFLGNGNGGLGEDVTAGVALLSDSDILAGMSLSGDPDVQAFLSSLQGGGAVGLVGPTIYRPGADPDNLSPFRWEVFADSYLAGAGYNVNLLSTIAATMIGAPDNPLTLQHEMTAGVFSMKAGVLGLLPEVDDFFIETGFYIPILNLNFALQQLHAVIPTWLGNLSASSYSLGYGQTTCGYRDQGAGTIQIAGGPLEQYWVLGGMFTLVNAGGGADLDVVVEFDPENMDYRLDFSGPLGTPQGTIHYFTIEKNPVGKALTVSLVNGWTWDGTNTKIAYAAGGSLVFNPMSSAAKQVCLISSNGGVLAP